jgi:hypothetical protein
MSYTASFATATCTITGLESDRAAALAVYDYLVNHPDEIPEPLDHEDLDSDDCVSAIETYLSVQGDELTISYSTEADGCYNPEVFDFLTSHFACLQSSPYMAVTWGVDDSRDGYSSGTDYYDRNGRPINLKAVLTAALS